MSLTEVVAQAVPSAKAMSVVTGLSVTAFLAGAGFVLGWSDYRLADGRSRIASTNDSSRIHDKQFAGGARISP